MYDRSVLIRPARESDADAIGTLAAEFVAYLASLGDVEPRGITASEFRTHGFGDHPAFSGSVAEENGRVVGYVLYHDGYDIDRGGRVSIVIDLFVTAHARSHGIGRALMEQVRAACRARGGRALIWSVFPPNVLARRFYERLGATTAHEVLMSWSVE